MRRALMLSVAAIVLSSSAWGWGSDGHRLVANVGMQALPEEVPAFLRTPAAIEEVTYLGPEADRQKGSGKSFDDEHSPGHYADVGDDLTIGGIALKALPVTREKYDEKLNLIQTNQYKQGYLPYSIQQGFELLSRDFALWRVAVWGEKNGKTPEQRAFYAKERAMREKITLHDLGYWTHFIGDGSQPLHTTVHFNGWGNYPNPEGFSVSKSLHSQFESGYVHGNITEKDVAAVLPAYRNCQCAVAARTAEYLAASQAEVVPLYRLEKQLGFGKKSVEGNAFVTKELARGAAELRDMVIDAWHHSAEMSVGYPEKKVADIEAGKVDPYESLN